MANQNDMSNCSSTSCRNPGTRRCTGCQLAEYCSPACQRAHWDIHKEACMGAKKYNCFIVRATPIDPAKENPTDADYIEPMPLASYGEWFAELEEVLRITRWTGILEPGRFYSHRPVNHWHYHVYQQHEKTETPRNRLMSQCFDKEIHGDVAVVRSSDVRVKDYSTEFSRTELVRTLGFYKNINAGDETFRRSKIETAGNTRLSLEVIDVAAPRDYIFDNTPGRIKPWKLSDFE
ncbi:hypothetical protein ABOM_010348 [Aspergillus bombycis]|uniref:MYND-type domain-containing protein n=1 Tax=Aspergillus bombycis TaxID=109264 RepID=A0A1F7ZQ40_9EURO|nr:hypothetical protein ABOM_010348 [Aspergillus bombycis]OGM41562.1 hypothetical protein ABOM_010348 [Aspergillus bombycis]